MEQFAPPKCPHSLRAWSRGSKPVLASDAGEPSHRQANSLDHPSMWSQLAWDIGLAQKLQAVKSEYRAVWAPHPNTASMWKSKECAFPILARLCRNLLRVEDDQPHTLPSLGASQALSKAACWLRRPYQQSCLWARQHCTRSIQQAMFSQRQRRGANHWKSLVWISDPA